MREVARGSKPNPDSSMLYIGVLLEIDMLQAIRNYALERDLSFSAATRELLEEALTRPNYLRVIK